jgi:hypothetical protein
MESIVRGTGEAIKPANSPARGSCIEWGHAGERIHVVNCCPYIGRCLTSESPLPRGSYKITLRFLGDRPFFAL